MFQQEALARGRHRKVVSRWQTDFGRWVSEFGVPRIVAALAHDPELRVTSNAVYQWLKGRAPRPERATALIKMSRGRLTLDAIYNHRRHVREARHASSAADMGKGRFDR